MDDVRPLDTQQCSQTTPQEPVQSQTLTMLQYIKTIMTTISGKKLLDINDQSGLDQAVSLTDTLMKHFSNSSRSEPMPTATWEQRFERLEAIVASKFTTPSYREIARAQQERESATSSKVKPIQAVPTLTLKLDINDGVTLIRQGLEEALKDTIPTRHGDGGVSRMRFLGKRSMLIVFRDVQARSYLESQIRTKMKDLCSISEPFYKMPTVRIEGLDNHDSGEELKAVLQHKFPQHAEKKKIILLHKTHSGNQQTAIVRVRKEIYANLVTTGELYFKYSKLRIKKHTHVTVCYKCQMYGHISTNCPNKTSCSYCAKEHSHKECENKSKPETLICSVCEQFNVINNATKPTNHRCHTGDCPHHRKALENTEAQTEY
ncbi:hypothetical protein HDE_10860 [Halotydeus destructor]|nr:hypothetical protein HDE_10860 [Halotydeus destructor]